MHVILNLCLPIQPEIFHSVNFWGIFYKTALYHYNCLKHWPCEWMNEILSAQLVRFCTPADRPSVPSTKDIQYSLGNGFIPSISVYTNSSWVWLYQLKCITSSKYRINLSFFLIKKYSGLEEGKGDRKGKRSDHISWFTIQQLPPRGKYVWNLTVHNPQEASKSQENE